jgi:para-aminobenzoate synthetase component 1
MSQGQAIAIFGDQMATELLEVTSDIKRIDQGGWWAVTQTFEGNFAAYRFAHVQPLDDASLRELQNSQGLVQDSGIPVASWKSSMTAELYRHAVNTIRQDIARGWVYQANLCRILTAPLNADLDVIGLWRLLRANNPAPYLSALLVPAADAGLESDVRIVSASPELFLSRHNQTLRTSPIKGTAPTAAELLEKDNAENIMIVDLVRNDLGQVCESGSVKVVDLLRLEVHPGLVHLVSDVEGELPDGTTWPDIFAALSPPGSVSGAPKSSALEVITRLETAPRDIYCGGFGWVDSDTKSAQLAVGIRTFWQGKSNGGSVLNFGTGAGITWGSNPQGEWDETELKASRLLGIAAMSTKSPVG